MKIEGPSGTQAASRTKKSGKADKADGSFRDMVAGGAEGPSSAGASQSIARVDALLAVQGAEDPAAGAARKRMRARSDSILNELDKIRTAMLAGTLTLGHMIDIADVVASHREKISDPVLTGIMDEIDLRAQVELAKMRRAIDAPAQENGV